MGERKLRSSLLVIWFYLEWRTLTFWCPLFWQFKSYCILKWVIYMNPSTLLKFKLFYVFPSVEALGAYLKVNWMARNFSCINNRLLALCKDQWFLGFSLWNESWSPILHSIVSLDQHLLKCGVFEIHYNLTRKIHWIFYSCCQYKTVIAFGEFSNNKTVLTTMA